MTTGALQTNLTDKRILGATDMRDGMFGYLSNDVRDLAKWTFRKGGVFDTSASLVSGGTDRVSVSPISSQTWTDGLGRFMVLNALLGQAIRFQNATGVIYQVALKWAQVPSGLQINPRTGKPEIMNLTDTIGESGAPAAVSTAGAGLKLVIDNLCETGVTHVGRTAVAWKVTPGAGALNESVAVETLTLQYDGVNNFVTTVAKFGETTAPLTPSLYRVVVLGPSIKRNTSMLGVDGYAFVGTVTGAGAGVAPSTFSTTNQRVIDTSLAGLDDITRNGTNGSLKVSVRADVGDANENQLETRDTSNVVRFSVNELGNTVVGGTFNSTGAATFASSVTVVGATALNGNVNIGDADSDTHALKGSLTHLAASNTVTSLAVNGATGRVGIGQAAPGSGFLGITGAVAIVGATTVTGTVAATGSGSSAGVVGTGGATSGTGVIGNGVTNGIGVIGNGAGSGAGVRGVGNGAGTGVEAQAGATGLGLAVIGGILGGATIAVASPSASSGAFVIGDSSNALRLSSTSTIATGNVALTFLHADGVGQNRDGWAIGSQKFADNASFFAFNSVINGIASNFLIFGDGVSRSIASFGGDVDVGSVAGPMGMLRSRGQRFFGLSYSLSTIGAVVPLNGNSFLKVTATTIARTITNTTPAPEDGQCLTVMNVGSNVFAMANGGNTFFYRGGVASVNIGLGESISFIFDSVSGVWSEIGRTAA